MADSNNATTVAAYSIKALKKEWIKTPAQRLLEKGEKTVLVCEGHKTFEPGHVVMKKWLVVRQAHYETLEDMLDVEDWRKIQPNAISRELAMAYLENTIPKNTPVAAVEVV
jgi:hypothetical protein